MTRGRRVEVDAARLVRWLDGFTARHGDVTWTATGETVTVSAADGAVAVAEVPFPPLDVDRSAAYGGFVDHVCRDRRVGVLLVRLGGHAVGVFDGPRLVVSKVGTRYVQGRTAAGGQSQQRFARRRANQAQQVYAAAADLAARILVPDAANLEAVVTGGDRRAVSQVLDDRRLDRLRPLVVGRVLDVPDPRRRVLEDAPRLFGGVRVEVSEPAPG